jgi:hypothetical protein
MNTMIKDSLSIITGTDTFFDLKTLHFVHLGELRRAHFLTVSKKGLNYGKVETIPRHNRRVHSEV